MGAEAVAADVEPCARPEFGDWSTPAALRAARVLKRSPQLIADELRNDLEALDVPGVAEWTVSGNGYVNARLDDSAWAPQVIAGALSLSDEVPLEAPKDLDIPAGKTLVEHTAINTNKAAHIGHLRNACLGDTVARMLMRLGRDVEVDNYVDDTGVQVADVVVGLRELGIPPLPDEPFDQYCSRVYVEVVRRYETDPTLVERRRETLRRIEERDNDVAREAKVIAGRVVDAHLATMARFGIGYDLLTWESDIIELGFWQRAFELLRDAGVIVYIEEGRNAGCWVLPAVEGDQVAAEIGDNGENDADKILVKSDGVATYTAKDIAYQLWKLGLLGLDFHYRPWHADVMGAPATTTAEPQDGELDDAGFGAADSVITVVDIRQAYTQQVVRTAVARLGHDEAAERSAHLGYEVVALTPAAARELGIEVEEGRTGGVAFSGRRGIEVRADDLLDRAIERLRPEARDDETAQALAAGAVRYYLEKFGLTTIINFDFTDALRITGETGIYLQYTHARAAGVLRKVEEDAEPAAVYGPLVPQERTLLARIDAYPDELAEAVASLSPSVLCAYAYGLASAFTDFYEHTPPIVREEDAAVRGFRRSLVAAAKATLGDCLGVLGISALDQV
jgi:arginyl-tRNA synthetase